MNKLTFDTDKWIPVPLTTKAQKEKGLNGSEGCQWPLGITRDREDGKLCFLSVDVTKPYKSTDGGKTWRSIGKGLDCGGNVCVEIDPNNKNHLLTLGVACRQTSGLFSSWDAGESWHKTFTALVDGHRDYRQQIVFDATTYDEQRKASKICYWSRAGQEPNSCMVHPALYKSTDCGETWTELDNSARFGDCNIAINDLNGWLYIGGKCGLWRSKDKGESFEQLNDKYIIWLHTVYTHPEYLYFTTNDGLYLSTDCGDSFTKIESDTFPTVNPKFLSVNPANTDIMLVTDEQVFCYKKQWKEAQYYSHDGGKTWEECATDLTDATIPMCGRAHPAAWSPDGKDVITLGGDFVMKSTDGGKSFFVSNEGFNAICIGSDMSINPNNEKCICLPCQDYNGFYSSDGGDTWTYINWFESTWGGMTYGGYCWDDKQVCVGYSPDHWAGARIGGKLEIAITRDGGKTIEHTGHMVKGLRRCMSVLGDDDTIFFGEWKTTDKGHTWTQLVDEKGELIIEGVVAHDYSSQRIFAINNTTLLQSYDKGESWEEITNLAVRPESVCYDHVNDIFYVAMDTHLYKIEKDRSVWEVLCGIYPVHRVAIYPDNTNIIYVTGSSWLTGGCDTVSRSIDGGKNWVVLTAGCPERDTGFVPAGAKDIIIRRDTKEVYVNLPCRGLWKIPIPQID